MIVHPYQIIGKISEIFAGAGNVPARLADKHKNPRQMKNHRVDGDEKGFLQAFFVKIEKQKVSRQPGAHTRPNHVVRMKKKKLGKKTMPQKMFFILQEFIIAEKKP